MHALFIFFFFQAEDGIRDLVRSRGLGDVYKRQPVARAARCGAHAGELPGGEDFGATGRLVDLAPEHLSLIHI